MPKPSKFSLQSIRTDGWFERIAESVASFQALCDILGERFFAFSLITGARITALTIDRRNPDESLVDFAVQGTDNPEGDDVQRLSLARFRQRLVSALIAEEATGPVPERETDIEAIQRHIGVRYLLLAPLFGYTLEELNCLPEESILTILQDGSTIELDLHEFQRLMRALILEELDRVNQAQRDEEEGIDLARIPEAEQAAQRGDHEKVILILGSWASPLAILLRTPDGQMLGGETRGALSHALGLLGSALVECADAKQGEEILRLAVQYAVDTSRAGSAYARLGAALVAQRRFGEALAPLRRAANSGAPAEEVWPKLGLAFLEQGRLLAAFGAAEEGASRGVKDPELQQVRAQAIQRSPALGRWLELCDSHT